MPVRERVPVSLMRPFDFCSGRMRTIGAGCSKKDLRKRQSTLAHKARAIRMVLWLSMSKTSPRKLPPLLRRNQVIHGN
jgi:hypothetical protein